MFSDVSSDYINISLLQTLTHLPVGLFLFKSHAEISFFFFCLTFYDVYFKDLTEKLVCQKVCCFLLSVPAVSL